MCVVRFLSFAFDLTDKSGLNQLNKVNVRSEYKVDDERDVRSEFQRE